MFGKYFTIVVIPQKTSSVSKIKVPLFLFTIAGIIAAVLLAVWGWMIYDYLTIKTQITDFESVRDRYIHKKEEIRDYRKDIERFDLHLQRIKELHYKLKVLTSLEKERGKTLARTPADQVKYQALLNKARKNGILDIITYDMSEIETDEDMRNKQSQNLLTFFSEQQNLFTRIPRKWPVKGLVTSIFGLRIDPFTAQFKPHNGIDISTLKNSYVYAPSAGIVVFAGKDEVFGKLLVIDHGDGVITRYGHNNSIEVKEGDLVEEGDKIARVGSTGLSTGPHLHYEVILNGVPQNPIQYIQD